MDEFVSRAKEVQQQAWSPGDDITVVDDGPVEIRQLLKPYVFLFYCYLCRHLASRCVCIRRISIGGEGNALYPVLSSFCCNTDDNKIILVSQK